MKTDTPKLSDLTPEQRRVLCAEALGWVFSDDGKLCAMQPDGPALSTSYMLESAIPDPDNDANGALLLIDKARASFGWGFELSRHCEDDRFTAYFTHPDVDAWLCEEARPCIAITSAFLLCMGLAKE